MTYLKWASEFTDDKFACKVHKRKLSLLSWPRLNGVFYEEVSALQLFVLTTITFCTNILCQFNNF